MSKLYATNTYVCVEVKLKHFLALTPDGGDRKKYVPVRYQKLLGRLWASGRWVPAISRYNNGENNHT